MSNIQMNTFKSREELAKAVAAQIAGWVISAAERKKGGSDMVRLALAGGGTPRPVYEHLAGPTFRMPWARVEVMPTDERCVSAYDRRSNAKMLKDTLGAVNLLGLNAGDVAVRPDVMLLGMGADGHIASLFPDTVSKNDDGTIARVKPISQNEPRVTLPLSVLSTVDKTVLMVCGKGKLKCLESPSASSPIGLLLGRRRMPLVVYYAD